MRLLFSFLILIHFTQGLAAANVLLFTVDSCRSDRLGMYGYDQQTTPHLDAWAKTGTVFRNSFSTTAWTAPGLVSILTGLYPPTHGINNRDNMGSPHLTTLLNIFKKRGYEVPNLNFFSFAPYYRNLGLPDIQREYFGEGDGVEIVNWLKKNTGSPESKPFFAWYHSTIVHQPYNPGAENLPRPRADLEKSPGIKAVMNGAIVPVGSAHFEESDKAVLNQLYSAELRRMDQLFQDVLNTLREKNVLKDTLIIFSADHGEELLDHGFVGHASTSLQAKLYQEIVRIPLIFSWPEHVPADKVIDTPVNQTDVFPTVLKLFDIETPDFVEGRNLLAENLSPRPLFFESVISGNQTPKEHEDIWVRGVLDGDFKYISGGELYDLKSDPLEQKNIIEQKPEVTERMRAELDNWLSRSLANHQELFQTSGDVYSPESGAGCPVIFTPENGRALDYDLHTGTVLIDWAGDKNTIYLVQYDIGSGDHHIAGIFEVNGNHQLLGPLNRELWKNLQAWNPFKIRVSPKSSRPCWSDWITFTF